MPFAHIFSSKLATFISDNLSYLFEITPSYLQRYVDSRGHNHLTGKDQGSKSQITVAGPKKEGDPLDRSAWLPNGGWEPEL
ncbi:12404_t:CDS:2 [Acaulospora colombiana]|uniref:12404_t:CDS:1 n=1 Tax=Acaulospora colombiana TaxID=27376 RepID=A0ACA9P024_9GLOM|nr:12404_t:CDS:2 [Acaulospora colombiana]